MPKTALKKCVCLWRDCQRWQQVFVGSEHDLAAYKRVRFAAHGDAYRDMIVKYLTSGKAAKKELRKKLENKRDCFIAKHHWTRLQLDLMKRIRSATIPVMKDEAQKASYENKLNRGDEQKETKKYFITPNVPEQVVAEEYLAIEQQRCGGDVTVTTSVAKDDKSEKDENEGDESENESGDDASESKVDAQAQEDKIKELQQKTEGLQTELQEKDEQIGELKRTLEENKRELKRKVKKYKRKRKSKQDDLSTTNEQGELQEKDELIEELKKKVEKYKRKRVLTDDV
mmetsp:Transcript_5794/g.9624  ORF Transcript_5794/g.9624 Transcript_5794/m.9624 type:complete len:285 (-) Transcript_5794:185-1039(-)